MSMADVLAFVRLRHEMFFDDTESDDLLATSNFRFRYSKHEGFEKEPTLSEEEAYSVWADCSDTFYWGSADTEKITVDTVDILKQSILDVAEYWWDDEESLHVNDKWGFIVAQLYAARVRKMRPQGACYKVRYPEKIWHLFDEAGPERKLDVLNPREIGE